MKRRALALLLLAGATGSSALAQSGTTSDANQPTKFLQGGVEHCEQMAPVQGLNVGTIFDQATNRSAAASSRSWYKVPPWLAGKWQADEQTRTSLFNNKTGVTDSRPLTTRNTTSVTRGSQVDRLGGIWDCIVLPRESDVIAQQAIARARINEESLIFDSDARVVVRYVITKTMVNLTNNTIMGVDQVEQFNTYSPAGPGLLRIDFSSKTFDQSGSATALSKGWMIAHAVAPFTLNNYDLNNHDIRGPFRDFLRSNEVLRDLVPSDQ